MDSSSANPEKVQEAHYKPQDIVWTQVLKFTYKLCLAGNVKNDLI
jgi:hypothetical protein